VAYRSRRDFRSQFQLLLESTLLEHAEVRLAEETEAGHRLRAWRARRDVQRLRLAVALDRRSVAQRTLRSPSVQAQGADVADVLPRLRPFVAVGPLAYPTRPTVYVRPRNALAAAAAIGGCTLAWAATAAEIARYGIADRPSLIVVEVAALVLSPIALTLSATPRVEA
jgi:hypothetical protein